MTMLNRSKLHSAKDFMLSQHQSQEVFKNARDFSVVGSNFIDNAKGNSKSLSLYAISFPVLKSIFASDVDELLQHHQPM
jgi:hypothetical protein